MLINYAFFDALSDVARAAIDRALGAGLRAENKDPAGFDPVTEADRAAERALRTAIEQAFPDHGIWGEEYGLTRGDASVRWSLDPVDGTRALVCGLPSWAVLVGLIEDGVHVAGMIDLPAIDERLVAVNGVTLRNGGAGCGERLPDAWPTRAGRPPTRICSTARKPRRWHACGRRRRWRATGSTRWPMRGSRRATSTW